MKLRKKRVLKKIAIGSFIAFAVSPVLLFTIFYLKACREITIIIKKGQQRQVRLLCETDHQALLEACREISRMFAKGDLKKYEYMVRINPDPEISSFPQVIIDLEPTYIDIDPEGCVRVELYGGLDHYGVNAYTGDFKPPVSNFHYGDRKLIDGLWYYDDGYANNPKYYGKGIEELIQKGKMKKQDKQDSEE